MQVQDSSRGSIVMKEVGRDSESGKGKRESSELMDREFERGPG